MIKPIDESKLPLRYSMRVYHTCKDFPNSMDVLFDLCESEELLGQKKFNTAYAIHTLSFKMKPPVLRDHMTELANQGHVSIEGTDKSPVYNLLSHPWE